MDNMDNMLPGGLECLWPKDGQRHPQDPLGQPLSHGPLSSSLLGTRLPLGVRIQDGGKLV